MVKTMIKLTKIRPQDCMVDINHALQLYRDGIITPEMCIKRLHYTAAAFAFQEINEPNTKE